MATRDIYTALVIADFRWLWVGSLASSFAMNMQQVARGWFVYEMTASAVDLAWVTMSFMIPQVIFSLWGGVVADRMPKRFILCVAQILNCVATLIMSAIILWGQADFWDFIWFGTFNGIVLALSFPARHAFVPDLVPERLVFTAMALNTTSMNFARILAPALAGFLIAWIADGDTNSTLAVGIVYLGIALLYLTSSLTILLIDSRGVVSEPDKKNSVIGDMLAGVHYLVKHPPVFGLLILSVIPFLFGMPLNTLLPAFNEDVLLGGPDDLGVLLSAMGGGAILGSLMLAARGDLRRKGMWLIGTLFAWGFATSAFGLSSDLTVAVVVLAFIGLLSSWNMSLNRGMLQLEVEQKMRGRVMSLDMMSHGLMPLGVLPVAWVADNYGINTSLFVSGIVFIFLVSLSLLMRAIRYIWSGSRAQRRAERFGV